MPPISYTSIWEKEETRKSEEEKKEAIEQKGNWDARSEVQVQTK